MRSLRSLFYLNGLIGYDVCTRTQGTCHLDGRSADDQRVILRKPLLDRGHGFLDLALYLHRTLRPQHLGGHSWASSEGIKRRQGRIRRGCCGEVQGVGHFDAQAQLTGLLLHGDGRGGGALHLRCQERLPELRAHKELVQRPLPGGWMSSLRFLPRQRRRRRRCGDLEDVALALGADHRVDLAPGVSGLKGWAQASSVVVHRHRQLAVLDLHQDPHHIALLHVLAPLALQAPPAVGQVPRAAIEEALAAIAGAELLLRADADEGAAVLNLLAGDLEVGPRVQGRRVQRVGRGSFGLLGSDLQLRPGALHRRRAVIPPGDRHPVTRLEIVWLQPEPKARSCDVNKEYAFQPGCRCWTLVLRGLALLLWGRPERSNQGLWLNPPACDTLCQGTNRPTSGNLRQGNYFRTAKWIEMGISFHLGITWGAMVTYHFESCP